MQLYAPLQNICTESRYVQNFNELEHLVHVQFRSMCRATIVSLGTPSDMRLRRTGNTVAESPARAEWLWWYRPCSLQPLPYAVSTTEQCPHMPRMWWRTGCCAPCTI